MESSIDQHRYRAAPTHSRINHSGVPDTGNKRLQKQPAPFMPAPEHKAAGTGGSSAQSLHCEQSRIIRFPEPVKNCRDVQFAESVCRRRVSCDTSALLRLFSRFHFFFGHRRRVSERIKDIAPSCVQRYRNVSDPWRFLLCECCWDACFLRKRCCMGFSRDMFHLILQSNRQKFFRRNAL